MPDGFFKGGSFEPAILDQKTTKRSGSEMEKNCAMCETRMNSISARAKNQVQLIHERHIRNNDKAFR